MNQPLDLDGMGKHFEVGDWKLLHILARNMEPLVFGEFMKELNICLEEKIQKKNSKQKPIMV